MSTEREVRTMFTIIYEIRISTEKVIECPLTNAFLTLEDAKREAEANLMAIAYRIFDASGYRIFSKKD